MAATWHNTQHTQDTNINVLSWIRTFDPNSQTAADQRLRPHDHRDRPVIILVNTM